MSVNILPSTPIRIVTRQSSLALAQTVYIADILKKLGYAISIEGTRSTGDVQLQEVLYKITDPKNKMKLDKALFTKELEKKLISEEADLAVHSLKDLPTMLPSSLKLLKLYINEDDSDTLIIKKNVFDKFKSKDSQLKIASSSLRRIALLKTWFPYVNISNIRGNVLTRLEKLLSQEDLDGTIMATAGLKRLASFLKNKHGYHLLSDDLKKQVEKDIEKFSFINISDLVFLKLSNNHFVPAVSQGVLGLETHSHTYLNERVIEQISHSDVPIKPTQIVDFSRGVLSILEAGCHVPLGLFVELCYVLEKDTSKTIYKAHYFYAPSFSAEQVGSPISSNDIVYGVRQFTNLKQESRDLLIQELEKKHRQVIFCGLSHSKFMSYFQSDGYQHFHLPLISVAKNKNIDISEELLGKRSFKTVFFTSKNSVSMLESLPIADHYFCVGIETEQVLKEKFKVVETVIPAKTLSLSMAQKYIESDYFSTDKDVLWVGAENGHQEGVELLKSAGVSVCLFTPYRTITNQIVKENIDIGLSRYLKMRSYWVFTSPSCVESYFKNQFYNESHLLCCIGSTTAQLFYDRGIIPFIISSYSSLKQLAYEISQYKDPDIKLQFTNWQPFL